MNTHCGQLVSDLSHKRLENAVFHFVRDPGLGVNMFLFPSALMMGGDFSIMDYLFWNEFPVVLGNLVGGIMFTGLTLYVTHIKTAPKRAI